jgi:hypothetical protein
MGAYFEEALGYPELPSSPATNAGVPRSLSRP